MPQKTVHEQMRESYLKFMAVRDLINPIHDLDPFEHALRIQHDVTILKGIKETRYLRGRERVEKMSILPLAWKWGQESEDEHRFFNLFRVSPKVFDFILLLISDHPVFTNNSNVPQAPVDTQLAVTLYRMGRFGNGASLEDIARTMGCSEGAVENYTERCFEAILSLERYFVRRLTEEEKEIEKAWVEQKVGFHGLWREGYLMYDGTIVPLYAKPAKDGSAYFTRKSNYGLNAQIGNTPSNLRIVDYSHGFVGSVHDAEAYKHTCAYKHPEYLYVHQEFGWGDSAYTLSATMIPIHRQPTASEPGPSAFDKVVSRIRVRSEHCMGALKSRFQCLRGLRVLISDNNTHVKACQWITIAIILHNLIIDVEGDALTDLQLEEPADLDGPVAGGDAEVEAGENGEQLGDGHDKRQVLIQEVLEYNRQRREGA